MLPPLQFQVLPPSVVPFSNVPPAILAFKPVVFIDPSEEGLENIQALIDDLKE